MGWDGMGWDGMGWDGMGSVGGAKRRIETFTKKVLYNLTIKTYIIYFIIISITFYNTLLRTL
jgi:hypothetical protein